MEVMSDPIMQEAVTLGLRARGRTAPNPMVGAIVTNSKGEVIGSGFHPKAGEPHAEVFAIREAMSHQSNLEDCILHVTLEPCNHFGRTPPCVDLILETKIKKVRVGALDPNPKMQGTSIEKLRGQGVTVETDILGQQCRDLIRGFTSVMKTRRPFVSLKCATSLDGKIATRSGESKWITGEKARRLAHEERAAHDAILVGVGTVIADDPQLTVRLEGEHSGLKKIILDSRLRTPAHAQIFSTPGPVIIYCDGNYAADRKERLEKAGATVVPLLTDQKFHMEALDLNLVLKDLAERGVQELMVEGGARVLGAFVRDKLFDRMVYFVSPKILGSESKDVFEGLQIDRLHESVQLENVSTRIIGPDIVIEGTRPCSPV